MRPPVTKVTFMLKDSETITSLDDVTIWEFEDIATPHVGDLVVMPDENHYQVQAMTHVPERRLVVVYLHTLGEEP
jgi:hypothetical protein